jgi:ribonucleoside-triphosphate reductase
MKDKTFNMQKETGKKWSLVQTPAESTAHRFAKLDQSYKNNLVQGEKGTDNIYYTNSSHVNVAADIPLWNRIKIESSFHPLLMGGAITHIFMNDYDPAPQAVLELTKKIATKTLCSYFSYTKDMSHCLDCGYVGNGMKDRCLKCNSENVEWYSRVTGYLTPVKAWNNGKKAELRDRKRYSL